MPPPRRTKTPAEMTSSIGAQPAAIMDPALGLDAVDREGEEWFELGLALVDLNLEQLRTERSSLEFDWCQAFEYGWSPLTAAFAAWAKSLRSGRRINPEPVT